MTSPTTVFTDDHRCRGPAKVANLLLQDALIVLSGSTDVKQTFPLFALHLPSCYFCWLVSVGYTGGLLLMSLLNIWKYLFYLPDSPTAETHWYFFTYYLGSWLYLLCINRCSFWALDCGLNFMFSLSTPYAKTMFHIHLPCRELKMVSEYREPKTTVFGWFFKGSTSPYRYEALNIKIDNSQTIYQNKTLTQNLQQSSQETHSLQ